MTTSEMLRQGRRGPQGVLAGPRWMDAAEYESVDQLRGKRARLSMRSGPGAYERAQYQRVLASWRR